MPRFQIKKVAVLGAGVMGAQIAAHLVNSNVPVLLFDLPAQEGPSNGVVSRALDGLKKLKPAPLAVPDNAVLITPANYAEHLPLLAQCDLIIEAIAERMDYKTELYQKIAPFVASHSIVASNTSGLRIADLSAALPDAIRPRFCGVHFFNPPRYMTLVELISTPATQPEVLDQLETFVTTTLGKGVVRALDTPNFIANRVGIAGILATIKEAENFGLSYDVVDDLTGQKMGRAKSGTFRTADVVGLDTMAHVIHTLREHFGSTDADPFADLYATPPVLAQLVAQGALGQKSGAGFYQKQGADILRLDPASKSYVPAGAKADEVVARMLKKPASERLQLLRQAQNPQAQFVWAVLRDQFHYVATHLHSIAHTARDVDLVMRWGFGMTQGPFELWQEAGWLPVAQAIAQDIADGKALCKQPLPDWVFSSAVVDAGGVHTAQGSWSASALKFIARSDLPVRARQHFPEEVRGCLAPVAQTAGSTVHEDEAIRLWTLEGAQSDVLIASLKTKMNTLGPEVIAGLIRGAELAEQNYKGMVIWSPNDLFSAGADLQTMLPAFMAGGVSAIERAEAQLQALMLRLRYAGVPVVAAIRGLALGGGCELAAYCAKRVAAMESYIGLVEVGVGLLPGAGGLTYIARSAFENASYSTGTDLLPFLTTTFTAAASATVGTSAPDSRKLGYLQSSDVIVAHKDELLFVAISQAQAMFDAGYRAPLPRPFAVAGRSGTATIKGQLINMRDGGFISAYDYHIASLMAEVVCGGDVEAGTLVTEEYVMALERRAFCSLLGEPKTQERIMGMLGAGKVVRN